MKLLIVQSPPVPGYLAPLRPQYLPDHAILEHPIPFNVIQSTQQENGAVSKVNNKFISHLTQAQRTPSAAAIVQVSRALPAVRFSRLLRGQFPR